MSYGTHDLINKDPFHSISLTTRTSSTLSVVSSNCGNLQWQLPSLLHPICPSTSAHLRHPMPGAASKVMTLAMKRGSTMSPTCVLGLTQQRWIWHSRIVCTAASSSGSGSTNLARSKGSRAPRMRWITALHAHFVHAVELHGGHESMFDLIVQVINPAIVLNWHFFINYALSGLCLFYISYHMA
jgi:hypothetical protein